MVYLRPNLKRFKNAPSKESRKQNEKKKKKRLDLDATRGREKDNEASTTTRPMVPALNTASLTTISRGGKEKIHMLQWEDAKERDRKGTSYPAKAHSNRKG